MKLKTITIENFRCYKSPVTIAFDDLTTIVGRNDVGKSTVLEALEIFFNNDVVKIDSSDCNIFSSSREVSISCDFCGLPEKIVLDAGAETSLEEEYLTIADDTIRITKKFDCSKSKPSEEVFIVAMHPVIEGQDTLLSLKERDLQKIVKAKGLDVPLKGNPGMRKAIWESLPELQLNETSISATKGKEDTKIIWQRIESYLPIFALFQSDRSSKDSDDEVQNPLKLAIQEALKEAQNEIEAIQAKVKERAISIAKSTQEALSQIDRQLANDLFPRFLPPSPTKWNGLFSISMDTNEGVPLNKRGSGIRRMILVSFFKAAAERRARETSKSDIIYAIEEPETAQHPNHQMILIESFKRLSQEEHCQIILTTHSPNLASELPIEGVRFVTQANNGDTTVLDGSEEVLNQVASSLGIFPTKHSVKALICVEGPTDVVAIKSFSRCLRENYPNIVDLDNDERIVIIPMGGSSLKHWVQGHYLRNLKCPEIHIYDSDVAKYQESIDEVNSRGDGSWGTLTIKYEIENYLHREAIKNAYNVDIDTDIVDVPKIFGEVYSKLNNLDGTMKGNKAKTYLSKVFSEFMTYPLLLDRDPNGEILSWFSHIEDCLAKK
ncbi:ATP-binding protein [uncultured Duncaniella sp.]|uniref:ATP-binding protein n=1 Tax=uncultured Duncaniella sp. TaxID=2768039 RepID=UPI00262EB5AB|nr:ATP-binding protein [uncultured Duncaniella sp.]